MKEALDILNKEEHDVIRQVEALSGTMDNIEGRLKEMHIPEIYRGIFNSYNSLYDETRNLEALKRSIFIQWYGASEPLAYTGIGELDKKLESKNLKTLIKLINTEEIDKEFKEMISHYYSISDWYFDAYLIFRN